MPEVCPNSGKGTRNTGRKYLMHGGAHLWKELKIRRPLPVVGGSSPPPGTRYLAFISIRYGSIFRLCLKCAQIENDHHAELYFLGLGFEAYWTRFGSAIV
jgi:hypothetical protein